MYQESAQEGSVPRAIVLLEGFYQGASSFASRSAELTKDQLDRVSQLTFRTNQFNFTTIRRSKQEIEDLFDSVKTSSVWWFASPIDSGTMDLSAS